MTATAKPEPRSYYESIRDGLCPWCGAAYGLGPNERHRLPRLDRGDGWDFIAPCGHTVLGIKKNSILAVIYGFFFEDALGAKGGGPGGKR